MNATKDNAEIKWSRGITGVSHQTHPRPHLHRLGEGTEVFGWSAGGVGTRPVDSVKRGSLPSGAQQDWLRSATPAQLSLTPVLHQGSAKAEGRESRPGQRKGLGDRGKGS